MNPSEPHANPDVTPAPEPTPVPEPEASTEAVISEPPVAAVPKVVGYCRDCGQPLYEGVAVHEALGAIYCATHRPAHLGQTPPSVRGGPWTAPPGAASFGPSSAQHTVSPYSPSSYSNAPAGQPWPSSAPAQHVGASPGLAFILGMIPGVGAVYNGQYAKGLIHVIIFALLIVANTERSFDVGPLFGLLIACFYFYMAFEAYHTAKLRRAGLPVDEFFGVVPRRGASRTPVGPIVLIVIGVLFLLSNLEIIEFRRLMRFWPALLIVLGIYMLYERMAARPGSTENRRDGQ